MPSKPYQPPAKLNRPAEDCFDESTLSVASAHRATYERRVADGMRRMQQRRVVIAGLARNLAKILPQTIKRIESLGERFADYRVVIYENDSTDRTLEVLKAWANHNSKVVVCSESRNDPVNQQTRCLSRATRMAYYRTQCQETISSRFADHDHVILVDMDLEGGWSFDGVANTFGHDSWDYVGAYGIIFRRNRLSPNSVAHYDAWAYRYDEEFTPLSTKEVNGILFERGEPLHRVTSCFGGLGVYQMPAYLSGRYSGEDVEHVTFHRQMRKNGFRRTYLNPSMITVYGRKHRTFDPLAARVLRVVDALPGRNATRWEYARPEAA